MDASYFREQADRCRLLVFTAIRPELKEQLRIWAREFEEIADAIEERRRDRERRGAVGKGEARQVLVD